MLNQSFALAFALNTLNLIADFSFVIFIPQLVRDSGNDGGKPPFITNVSFINKVDEAIKVKRLSANQTLLALPTDAAPQFL